MRVSSRSGDTSALTSIVKDDPERCDSKANREERYSTRFAAKEAAMKAIGTGWSHGVAWRDIEVVRLPGGRPTIHFHRKAAEFAAKLGAKNISLSLTHSKEYAIAQVILES